MRILNMLTQKPLRNYPKRGEIYIADLDPAFGREIYKKRPVLIISNNLINQNSFHIISVPFSSIVPEVMGPDMIKVSVKELSKESVILTNQIISIDKVRLLKKVRKISKQKIQEVEKALKLVLEL